MTKDHNRPNSFDEFALARFGDAINEYARGSREMELHAIRQCYPAVAALELDESYATLVLTSRMDSLLAQIIEFGAGRQGSADELLFDGFNPLSSFSAKTNMAYFLGFISRRMFDAINCCRAIRNVYAHSESPDDARNDPKYKKNKAKLIQIDSNFAHDAVHKLLETSGDSKKLPVEQVEVTALMVQICDCLYPVIISCKMYSMQIKGPVVPAIYGFENPPIYGFDNPSAIKDDAKSVVGQGTSNKGTPEGAALEVEK